MYAQTTPTLWSCLPTAFAMVLDIPVRQVIEEIGHDGSYIVPEFMGAGEPYHRRAFHIQELIDLCLRHGFSVTPIEAIPVSAIKQHVSIVHHTAQDVQQAEKRFLNHLMGRVGVITGVGLNGLPHAIAWDRTIGLDPKSGYHIRLVDFAPQTFYRIDRLAQSNQE